jgi:hypothetical protein
MADRKLCLRCGQAGHTSSSCKRKLAAAAIPPGPTQTKAAERWARVCTFLLSADVKGQAARDIQREALPELSTDVVRTWLQGQAKAGRLQLVEVGNIFLWCFPADAPVVTERANAMAKASAEAAMRQKLAANARRDKQRRILAAQQETEGWASAPFRHVLVSANGAPPITVAGPRSVFDLGAAA